MADLAKTCLFSAKVTYRQRRFRFAIIELSLLWCIGLCFAKLRFVHEIFTYLRSLSGIMLQLTKAFWGVSWDASPKGLSGCDRSLPACDADNLYILQRILEISRSTTVSTVSRIDYAILRKLKQCEGVWIGRRVSRDISVDVSVNCHMQVRSQLSALSFLQTIGTYTGYVRIRGQVVRASQAVACTCTVRGLR